MPRALAGPGSPQPRREAGAIAMERRCAARAPDATAGRGSQAGRKARAGRDSDLRAEGGGATAPHVTHARRQRPPAFCRHVTRARRRPPRPFSAGRITGHRGHAPAALRRRHSGFALRGGAREGPSPPGGPSPRGGPAARSGGPGGGSARLRPAAPQAGAAPPPARGSRSPPRFPPRPAALPGARPACCSAPPAASPPRLPMEAEAEVRLLLQEARECIEAARSYRRELEQRLRGLHQARKQIRESATLTRDVLEQHFNDLKGTLKKLLDERLMSLLQEVDAIEQESIKPLDECQKLIEHGVSTADDLLREGESAVHGDVGQQNEKLCSFTKKALHIQLDSLPEVPSLVDVPCLSAQLDDCLLTILKNQIFRHGTVASRPPVQLEEFVEKPGGILVRWCKVDDDFIPQDYRLQYRKGTANQFEDAYVGSETEFIVLHIDPNVDYQFRVCARGDGRQEWSPWSVPQIGCTTLVPHEWTAGLEGYSLSSRRNIALRNDSQSCGVLYSKAPTYFCGQTLTFRIETVGQPDRRDSLGVCVEQQNGYDSLQRDKAVCISTNGAVFVNGKEMTNQLPAVTSGSTVTFDMEVVQLGPSGTEGGNVKLRVTISSNNREVVFDWVLDQCCGSLYFGCSFSYPGWKVLVF